MARQLRTRDKVKYARAEPAVTEVLARLVKISLAQIKLASLFEDEKTVYRAKN